MIDAKQAKLICCEDISKIYGYAEAVADNTQTWDLHHCIGLVYSKQELIDMGLYYNQPAEYLMFVTRKQHKHLHHKFMSEDEHKRRSECIMGSKNGFYGKHHSEETKNKNKAAHKKHTKPVLQYTLDGQFVAEYPSLHEVKRQLGYDRKHVSDCCRGKNKTSYGYIWKYKS